MNPPWGAARGGLCHVAGRDAVAPSQPSRRLLRLEVAVRSTAPRSTAIVAFAHSEKSHRRPEGRQDRLAKDGQTVVKQPRRLHDTGHPSLRLRGARMRAWEAVL
jgi:hypothetical protein